MLYMSLLWIYFSFVFKYFFKKAMSHSILFVCLSLLYKILIESLKTYIIYSSKTLVNFAIFILEILLYIFFKRWRIFQFHLLLYIFFVCPCYILSPNFTPTTTTILSSNCIIFVITKNRILHLFYFSFPMFVFLLFLDQTSDLWYTFGDGDVDPEGIDKILLTKIWIPNLILPIWIWFTLEYLDSIMKKNYASRRCF